MTRNGYFVVGHLTATDADPNPAIQGKLDNGIDVLILQTKEEVESALLWYLDGIVIEREAKDAQSPKEAS